MQRDLLRNTLVGFLLVVIGVLVIFVKTLKTDLLKQESLIRSRDQQIIELQQSVESLNRDLKNSQAREQGEIAQLNATTSASEELRSQLQNDRQQLADLERQRADLQKKIEDAGHDDSVARLTHDKQDLQVMQDRVKQDQAYTSEVRKGKHQLLREVKELRHADVERVKEAIRQQKGVISALRAQQSDWKKRRYDMNQKTELKNIGDQIAAQTAALSGLQSQLSEAEQVERRDVSEMKEQVTQADHDVAEAKRPPSDSQVLKSEIKNLEAERSKVNAEALAERSTLRVLDANIQALKSKIEDEAKELQRFKTQSH